MIVWNNFARKRYQVKEMNGIAQNAEPISKPQKNQKFIRFPIKIKINKYIYIFDMIYEGT